MSCTEDPRNINGIITAPMRRFSSLGPWPSTFVNKPLSGGYGAYTVYPLSIPSPDVNPDTYYKMYIVTLDIANMPDASNSQNAFPDPKINNIMAVINNSGNYNDTIWFKSIDYGKQRPVYFQESTEFRYNHEFKNIFCSYWILRIYKFS
jgi:hypothetical protein